MNRTGTYESLVKQIEIEQEVYKGKSSIKVPIEVIAEDGSKRENILTITFKQGTYITGKITTENVNGEYISEVALYRTNDTSDPRIPIATATTKEDGTFRLLVYMENEFNTEDKDENNIPDALEEMYDVVVSKPGYLNYTVTKIEITENEETELDEHKLLAGDVMATGEIEIDDLVEFNDNYGVTITGLNQADFGKYDFNEDGIVDSTDRNILKANYGKQAEIVNMEEPLIMPLVGNYTLTCDYGSRIHPVTGAYSFHTGVDLAGAWHTDIVSIADGEVTMAGEDAAFGNYVEVKHIVNGVTIYSFYAHLAEIDVQVGDTITQGTKLGTQGGDPVNDTGVGLSTGSHLHFEIRTASGYSNDIDPNTYYNF